jgi:hypothetical protein
MAKFLHDDVLDALLSYIADNTKRITVCSQQPTTYTEGNATYALADITTTEGTGGGDFSLANGDTNGRKLTVAQQADVPVDSSGTATHIALLDVDNSKLLGVTTCTSQALTAGNTVTIPAFDVEVSDPS